MAEYAPSSFDVGRRRPSHPRRTGPPDLALMAEDQYHIPLQVDADKMSRRESRLGLRSIFGRNRHGAESEALHAGRDTPSRLGVRASFAEMGNWPYSFHSSRSEVSLPKNQQSPPGTSAGRLSASDPSARPQRAASASKRGALATWDPPPLFQAYPQAIRHAHLPACVQTAEMLLRRQGKRESVSARDGFVPGAAAGAGKDGHGEKPHERPRRRHRRDTSASSIKLDWTTKVYVLVTSGYMLQYAGEGSCDRLPEKVLQLGKDSAAFASDLIPGRHWVLQVSSVADAEGPPPPQDHRPRFGRFSLRAADRREASNLVMVFSSAEDMDGWLATLRREIEALGGKKKLSETGGPKADDAVLELRAQPSQRTLVVRDSARYSRVLTPEDLGWDELPIEGPEIQLEAARRRSFDDMSVTNSVVSHDGRQLDGLRDSTNRFSYVSSGQRTVITSDSSPSCSPTRDSFAGHYEDLPQPDAQLEVRLRPNAAAILDRRQSVQAAGPVLDFRAGAPPGHSAPPPAAPHDAPRPHISSCLGQPAPNFSLPHLSGKRQSLMESLPEDAACASPPPHEREALARGHRRPPPPSLSFSRPLSVVADEPSPATASSAASDEFIFGGSEHGGRREAPDSPAMFSWAAIQWSPPRGALPSRPGRHAGLAPQEHGESPGAAPGTPPSRRYAGTHVLRSSESCIKVLTGPDELAFPLPRARGRARAPSMPNMHHSAQQRDREAAAPRGGFFSPLGTMFEPAARPSSQGGLGATRSTQQPGPPAAPAPDAGAAAVLQPSALPPAETKPLQPGPPNVGRRGSARRAQPPHGSSPLSQLSQLSPSSSPQQRRRRQPAPPDASPEPRGTPDRRSMSYLLDSPPPAPAPNRALPPLPPKGADRSHARAAGAWAQDPYVTHLAGAPGAGYQGGLLPPSP